MENLFLSLLLLGDHKSLQMGGIDETVFDQKFTVGVVDFGVCEFVTESNEGVSEPVIYNKKAKSMIISHFDIEIVVSLEKYVFVEMEVTFLIVLIDLTSPGLYV